MIHWRYVLPRALGVVLIVITARYVLSPIVGYMSVRSLRAGAGIELDLDRVDVGLFPPRLHYHNVRLSHPGGDAPEHSTAAQAVELTLDGDALLRRRFVIRDARVSGLELALPPLSAASSQFPQAESRAEASPAMAWLADLFASAVDAEKIAAETLAANSEVLRRGDQIRRRWKNEYRLLMQRATQLETALEEVQQSATVIDNPLRDRPRADAATRLLSDIQQELASVREALEQMPADFQSDLLTMERAKQADLQRVREALPIDLAACEHVGSELMLRTAQTQIEALRAYIVAGRAIAHRTLVSPQAPPRGEVIDLVKKKQLPSFMTRRCELSGALRLGDQAYQLAGTLENVTAQPYRQAEPMRVKLDLQGEQFLRLEYTCDDSADIPQEQLTLHWPDLEATDERLGAPGALDLDLRQGRMQQWVQLEARGNPLDGQRVHGRLVSRRVATQLQLHAPPRYASTPLFTALASCLDSLDRVEVDADFRGTWDNLEIVVSTNLAAVLKTGLREGAAEQIEATREKLDARIDQLYGNELAELRHWIVEQQNQAAGEIAKVDRAVEDRGRELLSEGGDADFYLGRGRSRMRLQ